MSADFEVYIEGEAPQEDSFVINVAPDPDIYNRLRLADTTGRSTFQEFVSDTSNFSNPSQRTRLERGLMHAGSDNPDRGTIMIVFRGTANADDLNTDRVFAFRNFPSLTSPDLRTSARYIRNKQFIVEQMQTYFNGVAINGSNSFWDFYVTGHSLGGALSEVLSSDDLVHGGYSFSAPVDTPVHTRSYTDPETGARLRDGSNAPTYRSINYMDKIIGNTDATTGGDAIYDNVIQGTTYNFNRPVREQLLGHELEWFKNRPISTVYGIPEYNPGRLQRLQLGPQESARRTIETVKPVATSILQKPVNLIRRSARLLGLSASGRKRRRQRGHGPPPAYPLALTLAKEAYEERFSQAQLIKSTHDAILCPTPISCQEVKFYVCRWPRFNDNRDRDRAIGNLVKVMSREPLVEVEAFDNGKR